MSDKNLQVSEKDRATYLNFIAWLDKSWYGAPGLDMHLPLIAARYTVDEAELLTGIPFSPKTADFLAELKNLDRAELANKLDALSRKGSVYRFDRDGTTYYCLNDVFMLMRTSGWSGKRDEDSKQFALLADRYFPEFMKPWENISEKGLRVLPINEVIEDKRSVLPYEEVKKFLDSYTYFCVTHCPCRMKKGLSTGAADKYPTEVCLHFDRLAHYVVENGLGREITRREAEDILEKCADLGLIHAISNQQEGTDTICNCCNCCCMWFESVKRLKHSGGLVPSNFHANVNQDTCTGCGLCVKRCPMEALKLKDAPGAAGRKTTVTGSDGRQRELINKTGKISEINAGLCIGCGVCAYKCPSKSLSLVRNAAEHHPPKTGRDWGIQFITQRNAGK
jgi:ferredoxin